MKRFLLLILCLAQLFSFACAVPDTPYAPETLLLYHAQPASVQRVIDVLYAGAINGETEIAMPPATRYEDAAQAWTVMQDEFPELFHVYNPVQITYFMNAPEYAIAVLLEYAMTPDEYAAARSRMMAEAQMIAASASGTAYERELYLHDALAARTVYSQDAAASDVGNAYGALVNGSAVCEGYAHAMTLLCRLAGIPCSMVTGMAVSGNRTDLHAWNVVDMDGELLQTDCTFNDQDHTSMCVHWYFNRPAQDMASTHMIDAQLPLSNSSAWTYPRMSGGCIESADEMQAVFDAQYARMLETGMPMELQAADDALYAQLVGSINQLMTESAYDICLLTYSTNEHLRCITLSEASE